MEKADVKAIASNMTYEERVLRQKRLFLLGVVDSDTLPNTPDEQHQYLPESSLRNDDLFYEDLKRTVEERFGVPNAEGEDTCHGDIEFRDVQHMSKVISGLLDSLTNYGLLRLAEIVTEGSLVTFEKTRPQMQKVIKASLADLQSKPCRGDEAKLLSQVTELVTNQKNFHPRHQDVTLKSHRGAIMKVLDGLGGMPIQTLNAIHRKLKGISGYIPQLNPPQSEWSKDRLEKTVRTLCLEMIGQLGESDELQEPLAKAMAVAGLSLRLASDYEDVSLAKFFIISSETEALQNDILEAIQSLALRTRKRKIKELQKVLDPKSEMEGNGVKWAIKKMLIEYLFECSDMIIIPDSLFKALTLINKRSINRRFSTKDLIEGEVECTLNISASLRQVVLDCLPCDNIDQDFTDAYMEEIEESDDGYIFDEDDEDDEEWEPYVMHEVHNTFSDSHEEVQSTRDLEEAGSSSSQGNPPMSREYGGDMETPAPSENKNKNGKEEENPKKCRNQYLAVQKVSDEASLIASQLIQHMMEGFVRKEGLNSSCDDAAGESSRPEDVQDSASKGKGVSGADEAQVLYEAVKKVLPSLPKEDWEKLQKFMEE